MRRRLVRGAMTTWTANNMHKTVNTLTIMHMVLHLRILQIMQVLCIAAAKNVVASCHQTFYSTVKSKLINKSYHYLGEHITNVYYLHDCIGETYMNFLH